MRIHWKQVVPFFLLGLLLGAALGSWAHRAAFRRMRGGGPGQARMFERISRDLGLDEGQRTAALQVMEGQRARMQALQQKNFQEFESLRLSFKDELRRILRPDQQARFEAMTERWERRQRRGPGGPGGPGGPEGRDMMPPPPPPPPAP